MTNKQNPNEQETVTDPTIKKVAKKEPPKIKNKSYYDVKIECMIPATLTYRILAEDPHQAAQLVKGKSPNSVQHKLIGRKELILRVYDSGSSMMRFMKRLLG